MRQQQKNRKHVQKRRSRMRWWSGNGSTVIFVTSRRKPHYQSGTLHFSLDVQALARAVKTSACIVSLIAMLSGILYTIAERKHPL